MIFPENIGSYLSIDETSLTNGELYTIITNKEAKGKKGSLVAMIKGVKADVVCEVLAKIPEKERLKVKEVTLDMTANMKLIVARSFTNSSQVIDRFHVQKLAFEAVQEIRIKERWNAIDEENEAIEKASKEEGKYKAGFYSNGDSKKRLLARSRYLGFTEKV